jgi:LDH2 family malate/lactate/ureidoglycolate dehydrogenase
LNEYKRFSKGELFRFAVEAFLKSGVPEEDSKLVADSLVTANLRGVDSHGIMRVPYYVDGIRSGLLSPVTQIEVIRDTPISAVINGNRGFCIVVAYKAMRVARKKRRNLV